MAADFTEPSRSLFNHFFPSHPATIIHINVSEDGGLCAANITRFTTACEAVGLSHTELFGVHDVHEASETSLGRVALTVTILARLAEISAAANLRRASPPTPLNPFASPSRRPSPVPIRVRRAPRDGPALSPLVLAQYSSEDGRRDSIFPSRPQSELQAHMDQKGIELDDPSASRTPTISAFELPSETPQSADPGSLYYATTEPIIASRLLPRSPSAPKSPLRIVTLSRQSSSNITRPASHSRLTAGFKTQVSFADQPETSSEKTLQHSRQQSTETRLDGEGLRVSRQAGGQVVEKPTVSHDARNLAHSRSLAALEGRPVPPRLSPSDASPRHRPVVRRGQSLDVPYNWPEADSLIEEGEAPSKGVASFISGGARPSVIRHFSANGKFYVPRRSMSPAYQDASPATAGFPFTRSITARSPSDHIARRQSDELSIAFTSKTSEKPMNMKIHSMINLSSSGGAPSLLRERSNSVLNTLPLQILEFNEPGLPPVKYVRRL